MQKTILLQSAGILDEEAKCTLKQNVYIKDGKIFRIVAENEDDHSVVADETIDCSKYFVRPGLANLHALTAMNIFKGIACFLLRSRSAHEKICRIVAIARSHSPLA